MRNIRKAKAFWCCKAIFIILEFEHSYEPTGPFGAKSIGEIVINTPAPAITHAIYRATGVWHRELPITPEKVAMSLISL